MQLRATYGRAVKQATLVHELGHRHLWQLAKRLDGIDGHRTLYLVLDRVWAQVWGEDFRAKHSRRIRLGSELRLRRRVAVGAHARRDERARLWNELLALNGFPGGCKAAR